VRIKASFLVRGGRAELVVENNGEAVPPAAARVLFREPVPTASGNGLGIGMYQVARLAAQSGYAAELLHNEPGCVRFRLRPA
jgi:sensor histidine kinase regulating citrate/malate metabolism